MIASLWRCFELLGCTRALHGFHSSPFAHFLGPNGASDAPKMAVPLCFDAVTSLLRLLQCDTWGVGTGSARRERCHGQSGSNDAMERHAGLPGRAFRFGPCTLCRLYLFKVDVCSSSTGLVSG